MSRIGVTVRPSEAQSWSGERPVNGTLSASPRTCKGSALVDLGQLPTANWNRMNPTSANFAFLQRYGEQLHRLAVLGEGYFRTDPNSRRLKK